MTYSEGAARGIDEGVHDHCVANDLDKANSTWTVTAATPGGVIVRFLQRILALTAAIWHTDKIGAPVRRSLTAYEH